MCGRFALIYSHDFSERYKLREPPVGARSRYNIAPGQETLTIVHQSPNRAVRMRWGLVPSWAKDPAIGYRMINARAETLATKPSFRRPLTSQRCLVPASGFYEWKKLDEKNKVPYFVHIKGVKYFSLAGLYDTWKDSENNRLETFTIITVPPNGAMRPIHDRMPAILTEEEENLWLDFHLTDISRLLSVLKPWDENNLDIYQVSPAVNSPANEGESLINQV